jgi:rhodanese-related sulfurtransferase
MATTIQRISPQQAHACLESDANTLLVCAYDSAEKFEQNQLEGAISLDEFLPQIDIIPRDREIIFYCA